MKFSRNKLKYLVNEKFFNGWNRQNAYVLGFTYADGNIYKTSLSWDIQKGDLDVLKKINRVLGSTYPIKLQRENSYRLRISNQVLVNGAIKKGLLPKKNIRNVIPHIPKNSIRHFIRGYLDGDGWIVVRKDRNEANVGFANGTKYFLEDLNKVISKSLKISAGKVRTRTKITPKGLLATTYQLEFYSSSAFKLANWLYGRLKKDDLYLSRKYRKFLTAKKLYEFLNSGTKGVRIIQKKFGRSIDKILTDLYLKQGLDGVKTAGVLGVHSSSVYRWLARTGIKYPKKRSRKFLWTKLWS